MNAEKILAEGVEYFRLALSPFSMYRVRLVALGTANWAAKGREVLVVDRDVGDPLLDAKSAEQKCPAAKACWLKLIFTFAVSRCPPVQDSMWPYATAGDSR